MDYLDHTKKNSNKNSKLILKLLGDLNYEHKNFGEL